MLSQEIKFFKQVKSNQSIPKKNKEEIGYIIDCSEELFENINDLSKIFSTEKDNYYYKNLLKAVANAMRNPGDDSAFNFLRAEIQKGDEKYIAHTTMKYRRKGWSYAIATMLVSIVSSIAMILALKTAGSIIFPILTICIIIIGAMLSIYCMNKANHYRENPFTFHHINSALLEGKQSLIHANNLRLSFTD